MKTWEAKNMLISDLNEAEYNPRTISNNALYKLGKSIDEFGLVIPIVWNKRSKNIVGGHQRIKVLKERGIENVDVIIVDLNENDEVALNITLNNPNIQGEFTEDAKSLLDSVENKLGKAFADVGLNDLSDMLKGINWDDNITSDPDNNGGAEGDDDMPGEENKGIPDEHIGINCPRCHSIWHRDTGRILKDENTK